MECGTIGPGRRAGNTIPRRLPTEHVGVERGRLPGGIGRLPVQDARAHAAPRVPPAMPEALGGDAGRAAHG